MPARGWSTEVDVTCACFMATAMLAIIHMDTFSLYWPNYHDNEQRLHIKNDIN